MNRKRTKNRSIRTSIVASFVALIFLIIIILLFISYRITIRKSEELSIDYMNNLLSKVNFHIDTYIENIKSMGTVVVENNDIRHLMAFYSKHKRSALTQADRDNLHMLKKRATQHMNIIASTRSDIANIIIVSKYGDIILSDSRKQVNRYSDFNLSDWYLKPMSVKENIVVSPSHVQDIVFDEYRWVISISKAILDPYTGEVTGVMLIDLNYHSIEDICARVQVGTNGYIYLIDSKGNLIYHPDQPSINFGIEQLPNLFTLEKKQKGVDHVLYNKDRIFLRNDSTLTGWSAVGVVQPYDLISMRPLLVHLYVALAVSAILFALLLADGISWQITQPITQLESTMRKVEAGDMEACAIIERNNEIGHMSQTFNTMIGHLRDAMEREVAKEEEKRKSEIQALQAQINPHFLYNTLDSIIWMSARGKSDEVMEMASALAQLFRTSISRGDSLSPVHVEIENIKSYLTIQKIRYRDKLNYSLDIPADYMQFCIPRLILQPIVENAIYHGVKPRLAGGSIYISAKITSQKLIFIVEDDGVGMSTKQITQVFDPLSNRNTEENGIGIRNVEERIRLLFGEAYGLRYFQREEHGIKVEIHLPCIHCEEIRREENEQI